MEPQRGTKIRCSGGSNDGREIAYVGETNIILQCRPVTGEPTEARERYVLERRPNGQWYYKFDGHL
jgi:hypothetical protein